METSGPLGVILVYHRVARVELDPFALSVAPDQFAEQLDALARVARIAALSELVALGGRGGSTDDPVVALTFDDGYADTFESALPILAARDLPATTFVVTGFVAHAKTFWWDELTSLVFTGASEGAKIELTLGDVKVERTLGVADIELDAGWRYWDELRSDRAVAYRELWEAMRSLPQSGVEDVLARLRAQLPSSAATPGRSLTLEELHRLARGKIEIGAHTRSHPRLSALTRGGQETEIMESKKWLENLLGRPVRAFSYPYGGSDDYGAEAIETVRSAGFEAACTARPGAVTAQSSPFELPRLSVENWNADELVARVEGVLYGDPLR